MEKERQAARLWTPGFMDWSKWHSSDFGDDEEDPDTIQGVPHVAGEEDLGTARRRDPDALPPRNHFEWAMSMLYRAFASLGSGNTLFALKAATLTGQCTKWSRGMLLTSDPSHTVYPFIFKNFGHICIRKSLCVGHYHGASNTVPVPR